MFNSIDVLWLAFATFYQFIIPPLLGLTTLYLLRRKRPAPIGLLASLFVATITLLGAQLLAAVSVIPFARVSTRTFTMLYHAGLPIWFLVAGLGITIGMLNTASQRAKPKLYRQICGYTAKLSLALVLVIGVFFLANLVNSRLPTGEFQSQQLSPNPEYYLPARPIRGTTLISTKLVGTKLQITYRDQFNQLITLTETPNASTSSVFCSASDVNAMACTNIGNTTTGGAIVGAPGEEYRNEWQKGFYNVRAVMGTTLIEVYEPTSLHVMQDDFVSYLDGFKRVGLSQISN